jgi:hypothetical protein
MHVALTDNNAYNITVNKNNIIIVIIIIIIIIIIIVIIIVIINAFIYRTIHKLQNLIINL